MSNDDYIEISLCPNNIINGEKTYKLEFNIIKSIYTKGELIHFFNELKDFGEEGLRRIETELDNYDFDNLDQTNDPILQ